MGRAASSHRHFAAAAVLAAAAVTVFTAFFFLGCGSSTTSASSSSSSGGGGATGGSSTWGGGGDGVWRRDAMYGESASFDPCNAHQPGSGEYHYHVDPVCLRFQLGDNITGTNVGTATASYKESTGTLAHSPILGWSYDGYPVYGPYGYASAMNAGSGVRRMVSGFTLRNITVRQTLPQWAATAQGTSTTLTSSQYGPAVSAAYPLGRYVEDYDFSASTGDLDQYNGRFCVTPEFPNGTYAYFVTIKADGTPAFPYYLSAQYYGTVSGGTASSITETTTTYFNNHALQSGSSSVPAVFSWLLKYTAQYAQILNGSNLSAGLQTTWTGNTTATYADVQQVRYSSNYVYINASGLASHVMGPWYLDPNHTQVFPNLPTNQNVQAKIPLTPVVASTKTATGGGAQGRWVNGVAMFNMLDMHSWSNSAQADQ